MDPRLDLIRHYFPRDPVLDIASPDYCAKAPACVTATRVDFPLVVVRKHGVYACAEDLDLACKWSCSFELFAKTALLAGF